VRLVVVVVCALLATLTARAQENREVSDALAQIAKLETALEYEQALVLADRTIARGVASRDQLADLHLIAGRLAAGLDHPDIAQVHFARVLALRPGTTLVAGTSPKLLAPFDAARAEAPSLALELRVAGGRATASVARDSLHLVAGIRVATVAGDGTRSTQVAHALELALPANTRATQLEAIDEAGNQLAVEAIAAPPPPPPPTPAAPSTPIAKHWITYAAVAGVALAGAGACAWRYGVAQDEWNRLTGQGGHEYAQLHAIEQRGQRWAIAADVGFGLAALAGVTSAILFATRDPEPRAAVVLTGTGVGFVTRF
jgi:hypothetical protein